MEERIEERCKQVRADMLALEKDVRAMREEFLASQVRDVHFKGDPGECMAHVTLSLRHLEDARMRIGKVIQYAGDGVSIYDKL